LCQTEFLLASFGQVRFATLREQPLEIGVLTTAVSYRILAGDLPRSLERAAEAPPVKRESAYYLANIGNVKSIEDFIGDDRLFAYAMKAFGLEDMTYAKAFMRKALEGGIDNRESFANSLADSRYKEFVEAFNFARHGENTTVFTRAQQGTVDRYVRQTLEEDAGATSEGVRLALYFERKAATIETPLELLADPALLKVVQTALRIPAESAMQDIDRQVALISARLDVADLKDPEKLQEFLTRFTSLWDLDNPPSGATSPALALFVNPTETSVSTSLLMSLQKLKLGGL
jgi:hypothetical protein